MNDKDINVLAIIQTAIKRATSWDETLVDSDFSSTGVSDQELQAAITIMSRINCASYENFFSEFESSYYKQRVDELALKINNNQYSETEFSEYMMLVKGVDRIKIGHLQPITTDYIHKKSDTGESFYIEQYSRDDSQSMVDMAIQAHREPSISLLDEDMVSLVAVDKVPKECYN